MSRGGASAEDDAGWDAIGEKDGAIGYEAVLTDQRRQRRRIEHGTDEGQKGVRRGMVGLTLSSSLGLQVKSVRQAAQPLLLHYAEL